MKIKHLTHSEINRQKWDNCLQNAANALVYAESWYLDIVSPNWEALVTDDYEYVMPLPVKRKYSVSFLVQPPLTQQLGVFSSHNIDENIVNQFIQKIPYRSYDLNFNEKNPNNNGIEHLNFVLDLNRNYEDIFAGYSNNTKRNIKKAQQYPVEIKADLSANDFLEFYHAIEKNYSAFPKAKVNTFILESCQRATTTLYGAYNENNKLTAVFCLLHSSQRLVYLLPASNREGKESLAMFKIVDEVIRKYANHNYVLDFDGSNIKNIARFYEGFGAKATCYYEIKRWSINDFIKRFCFWR